jgi:hypothetical protein
MPKRQSTAQKKARAMARADKNVLYTEALTHYKQEAVPSGKSRVRSRKASLRSVARMATPVVEMQRRSVARMATPMAASVTEPRFRG